MVTDTVTGSVIVLNMYLAMMERAVYQYDEDVLERIVVDDPQLVIHL